MRLKKARSNFYRDCDCCSREIRKDTKRNMYQTGYATIGNPRKETCENGAFIMHGVKFSLVRCEDCAKNDKPLSGTKSDLAPKWDKK